MSIKQKLAVGSIAPALAATVLAVSPNVAHAYVPGPACDGPTCVGQSPYITNRNGVACADDATTVKNSVVTTPGSHWTVELRWSAYCQANWVKFVSGPADISYASYYVETADKQTEPGTVAGYSTMVNGEETARVCVYDEGASDATWSCSAYF